MNAPATFAAKVANTEPPPFDWDAYNAKMDANMAALKVALARWHNAEQALTECHLAMVREVRGQLSTDHLNQDDGRHG